MKAKYLITLALGLLFTVLMMNCASKQVTKEEKEYGMLELPSNPFHSGFDSYAFFTDKKLIKRVLTAILDGKGIDVNLMSESITKVFINKIEDDFLLFIQMDFGGLISKKTIFNIDNMNQEGSSNRFWSIEDARYGNIYFDIAYKNVIGVTNIEIPLYSTLDDFDWNLDSILQETISADKEGFWFLSKNMDFADKFAFDDGYLPEWGFISTQGYDVDGFLLTTLAIPYSGTREDKTTIKMILPSILDNFDVKSNSALPFIDSKNSILLVEGVYISPENIHKYVENLTYVTP